MAPPPPKPRRGELNVGELLMFGYSCKLFRDDEKALYIDQGKHLIPWMGEETVKIDRYDGRGALYDLKQYEPLPGGFDSMMSLTNEERRIEQMCDEERYYALNKNEDVDLLYQEEELKRLQAAGKDKMYGEVGFNYNDDGIDNGDDKKEDIGEGEETDKDDVFVLIPQLDMPVNTVLPTSKKHFAIIEKTAAFIHSQGAQMEILLKMKQAANPHFGFLSFDNPLYPFYRHVLSAIQSGRYLPGTYEQTTSNEHNSSSEQEDYLHPSLQVPTMSVLPESAPSVPSIAYKPSENCAYSMLISKIREKQTILPPPGVEPRASDTSRSPSSTCTDSRSNSPSPAEVDEASPSHVVTKPDLVEPILVSKSAVISGVPEYYNPEDICSDTEDEAAPSSASDRDTTDCSTPVEATPPVLIPDPALKLIIDKLVLYVAKNGRDFEIVVKRKCDPRFSFLEPEDKHNAYYERELLALQQIDGVPVPSSKQPGASRTSEGESAQKQSLLRFSIKKPRAEKTIPAPDTKVKCALEDSSDEGDEEAVPSPPPPPQIIPPPPVISGRETSLDPPSSSVIGEAETAPPPPAISGSDLTQSRSERRSGESDEKKAERKRRAEMFLKMLQRSAADVASAPQQAQPTSSVPVDEVEHLGTVHKNSNGSENITVINVLDSDDSDCKEARSTGTLPPLDLKAKLRALRTRSKSPALASSPKPSSLLVPPPPPKIRKLKSSRHSHHKHGKRKKSSRSRSASHASSDDSERSLSKRSKSRKKGTRRDPSRSPSPKRSHRTKDSKKAAKKKKKRDDDSPPSKKSKARHKQSHHKRKRSHSRSASPCMKSKTQSKSKRKRRKSSASSQGDSSDYSDS